MRKLKEGIQKVYDDCQAIYEKNGGYAKVFDHVTKQKSKGNPDYADVVEELCEACDNEMPSLNHICLICGQETKPMKPMKFTLVDDVIENLKKDILAGDVTVLDELLHKLSIKTLVASLPEEDQEKYKELNNSYFEIMHQDFCKDSQREEIQIHAGENGNIFIFQDDDKLGFIVDVYGQEDHINTMTVWEEDLEDGTEDMDKDDNGNCLYCGKKCWDGEMCDEQQAGGFN